MTADLTREKSELRLRMRALRDALPPETRAEASEALANRVERRLAGRIASGTPVASFLPIGTEIDPRPAAARLAALGAAIAVPALVDGELVFRRLRAGAALEPQGFGTQAPGPDAPAVEPLVLLVPLLAFDGAGRRIGYGRGFYDRAVARLRARDPGTLALGVAFEAQRVERVPTEGHDQPLDAILTESAAWDPSETLPAAARR